MTKEEAARRQTIEHPNENLDQGQLEGLTDEEIAGIRAQRDGELHLQAQGRSSHLELRSPEVEKTMSRAQRQADKTQRGRRTSLEDEVPERTLGTQHDGAGGDMTHLPVVEEAGESNSTGERSNANNSRQNLDEKSRSSEKVGERMPNGGIRQVSENSEPTQGDGEVAKAPENKRSYDLPPGRPQTFFEAHCAKRVSLEQGEDPSQPPQVSVHSLSPLEAPSGVNGTKHWQEGNIVNEKERERT